MKLWIAVAVLGLTLALALSGCAAGEVVSPPPSTSDAGAAPSLPCPSVLELSCDAFDSNTLPPQCAPGCIEAFVSDMTLNRCQLQCLVGTPQDAGPMGLITAASK